jgi:Fe-S cluster assembly ATP-binding protein
VSNNVLLKIEDLHVKVEGNEVVKGVNLELRKGETHAIMGPNGSGKSSMANALAGHPAYEITDGRIELNGQDLLEMEADERSLAGLFLAFQYPLSVPGVTVTNFLRTAMKAHHGDNDEVLKSFRKELKAAFDLLQMDEKFASRYVNDGFSGGEKKRFEILQMAMLRPNVAILDETDSGLDIDALKIVSDGVNKVSSDENAILMVTHYQRILNYVTPDHVHVMMDGRIVRSGGAELAHQLEDQGYDWIKAEVLAAQG